MVTYQAEMTHEQRVELFRLCPTMNDWVNLINSLSVECNKNLAASYTPEVMERRKKASEEVFGSDKTMMKEASVKMQNEASDE